MSGVNIQARWDSTKYYCNVYKANKWRQDQMDIVKGLITQVSVNTRFFLSENHFFCLSLNFLNIMLRFLKYFS